MTINQIIKKYSPSAYSASFIKEAEILIADVIKKSREFVVAHPKKNLSKNQIKKIDNLIKRRLKKEPLAYILGKKNFYGLDFIVNKNVLIPRPETELMVEKVLNLLSNKLLNKKIICIDIGTGSGCVISSLAKNTKNKNIKFIGLDISSKSLQVAKKNINNHGLKNKVTLKKSNLLEEVISNPKLLATSYQLLVTANLPYLSEKIYNSADESVKDYEPKKALISGQDGLDYYRKMLNQIKSIKLKNPKIRITAFFEISPEQKDLIEKEIIQRINNPKIKFYKDLAKKWRLVKIKL